METPETPHRTEGMIRPSQWWTALYAPSKYFTEAALDQVEVGFECEFGSPIDPDECESRFPGGVVRHCYEDGPRGHQEYAVEAVTNWWPVSTALGHLHTLLKDLRKLEVSTYQNSSCHINMTHIDKKWNCPDLWEDRRRRVTLAMAFPSVGIHRYLDRASVEGWCPSWTHAIAHQADPNSNSHTVKDLLDSDSFMFSRRAVAWNSCYNGGGTRIEFRVPGGADYHTVKGEERIKAVTKVCAAYVLGMIDQPGLMKYLAKQNEKLAERLSHLPTSAYAYYPKAEYVDEGDGDDEEGCEFCDEEGNCTEEC